MAKRLQKRKEDPVTPSQLVGIFLRSGLVSSWRFWLPRVLLIAGLTLWVYGPALHGDWVWDDAWYVTTNPLMHGWTGLWKLWFQPGSWVEYYPVQETVQWVQWQLWGNDTLGYHLTNVFLHIVNALLVWRLLGKFGLRLAWLGGLIFAVHPVQVESVAWISELKNALSLPFFLLAMGAWIDYEEHKRKRDYQVAIALFLAGMLCKITLAPFPVVILLYAWWKRGRVEWSDLKASAPFFVISLALGLMTIWVGSAYEEAGHAQVPVIALGDFFSRLANAGLILSFYFSKCFLPLDLAPVYPKWTVDPSSLAAHLPWLMFAGVFYWFWIRRRSWGPHALLGCGFFVINLAPFLGFYAISYMNDSWVELHLLYLPMIGLLGLVVAGLGNLDERLPSSTRPLALAIMATAIFLMAWEGRAYAGWFVNEETLWSNTLQRNPNVWLPHHDLGCYLLEKERYPEAIAQLETAIRLKPDFGDGYYNLAIALDKIGRTTEAQKQYRQALALDPNNANAYLNLGMIAKRNGDFAEAETLFTQAVKLAPNDAAPYINLGNILLQTGRLSEAVDLFDQAVALNPDVAALHYNLGNALLQTGHLAQAVEQLTIAVTLDPDVAPAHENLGVALARSGNIPGAIEQFQAALQLDPSYAAARDNLGLALAQTDHIPEAIEQFQAALAANPNDANARQNLAKLQEFLLQPAPGKN